MFWKDWKKYGTKIYRTDEEGEIILEINKNGGIATKNSCKKTD